MQISRIRLSDKTSRLRPRHVVPKPVQAYEPEVPVQVREWIAPALAPPPDFVLGAQPPTQPHCRVIVERSISRADGAYLEVVRPSGAAFPHNLLRQCVELSSDDDLQVAVSDDVSGRGGHQLRSPQP